MEVIAGDPALGFEVEVKENGLRFKFDFSQVYWNPRLSTEHQRLVESVPKEDLLCDVFAGVGPFAVPAAKKGIDVTANDLNPNSYKWLKENATLNKVSEKLVCVNKDGRDFIRENVREKVATGKRVHVAMNLPALAVEFLDAFRGLLSDAEDSLKESALEPIAHVYAFTKEGKEAIRRECETALGLDSGSLEADCQLHFVRNVAPNKDMFRATFKVPRSALFETGMSSETDSPSKKRRKMEPDGSKDEEEEES